MLFVVYLQIQDTEYVRKLHNYIDGTHKLVLEHLRLTAIRTLYTFVLGTYSVSAHSIIGFIVNVQILIT
jgi:hypothetical protein